MAKCSIMVCADVMASQIEEVLGGGVYGEKALGASDSDEDFVDKDGVPNP